MNGINSQMQGFGAPVTSVPVPQVPTPVTTMGGTGAVMPSSTNLSGIGVQAPVANGAGNVAQATGSGTTNGIFDSLGGWSGISSGIQTLGNLYLAFQQNKLAKDSLNFQKESYATNLENQTQTYNTALEDRIRARYNTEGKSTAQADKYLQKNSL